MTTNAERAEAVHLHLISVSSEEMRNIVLRQALDEAEARGRAEAVGHLEQTHEYLSRLPTLGIFGEGLRLRIAGFLNKNSPAPESAEPKED